MSDINIATNSISLKTARPIVIIGAGGIVNDAHLPAYHIAGYTVAGIYDINNEKAKLTARKFSIPIVYEDIKQLLEQAPHNAVFDIAVPAAKLLPLIRQLPDKSIVLMQKPMGECYEQAKEILELTTAKKMIAGVNFQLRYAPNVVAARNIIRQGYIGDLCDIEVNVNVFTPWHLWDFLFGSPRVEILYHSIHYIDLVRSFLGNPRGVFAKTVKHPQMAELASVKSNIIMDYGDLIRANILTNHCHRFGSQHQQSYVKFEGTRGAIKIQMGALLNYPNGTADRLEYIIEEKDNHPRWKNMHVEGSWFPHAFIGAMNEMMKVADDPKYVPDNSVKDCIYTMSCVEAAYQSNAKGTIIQDNLSLI